MIKEIGVTSKYFNKGSISFSEHLRREIERGVVTKLKVYNTETKEFLPEIFDAKAILQAATSYGGYYVCKLSAVKVVAPIPQFFTQVQIAESWKVRQCRLAELGRAELLIPTKKNGNILLYSREAIETALKNPTVLVWIKNTSGVDNG